ncbi:hypothetical protein ABZ858_07290 [Streptomyces sp. NPDC047017]|uniref:hypothetical protein n=1 Tax=Streptomyces sp. NPDC047017 TaxID=3155024 RepID=UPI0033EBCBBD
MSHSTNSETAGVNPKSCRGQDSRPGTLHAASISFGATGGARLGNVRSAQVRAPYPAEHVRHASDVEVTGSGTLLVSSAADPGDDGPFASAVYAAGRVTLDRSGTVRLTVFEHPRTLRKSAGHKVEAIGCVPGSSRAVLGTDDENAGGSLTVVAGLCRH